LFIHGSPYPKVDATQRFAVPALGRERRSHPLGKKLRRRKTLENGAESPASGAPMHEGRLHFSRKNVVRS